MDVKSDNKESKNMIYAKNTLNNMGVAIYGDYMDFEKFSIKDMAAVSEDLLISTTENAKKKAEILAKASGVILGDLVSIDYNWGELHLYSQTRYAMEDKLMKMSESYAPDIEPNDIDVSDTVTFVWEIR